MSRQEVMGRIREALSVPTKGHPPYPAPGVTPAHAPTCSGDIDALWSTFKTMSDLLKTETHRVKDREACDELLRSLAKDNGWTKFATHTSEMTAELDQRIGLPALWTDDGYDVAELEACPVGITDCEALIAQTASVAVSAKRGGGRGLSILPPHHVVLATKQDLLPDLPAGFALLAERYQDAWPSFMSFITGPSRTGDIERILVLGAHGPKRLTVILIEEES